MNHRNLKVLVSLPVVTLAACGGSESGVTDAMLQNPDAADWPMWRRTLDGWGYTPLEQIDAGNVGELELVWSYPLGSGIQESTPLIQDGRMYVPNHGDYLQSFDAATGELLWEYRRVLPEGVGGDTNRNFAIWGNLIITSGSDNFFY
jgi:alcohol dehydrogenase (cytochrome c)